MKSALQILFMISLLSVGLSPQAQEAPEQPRYYDIEIIVFARSLQGAGDTEYWPPLDAPPDWSEAIRMDSRAASRSPDRDLAEGKILKLPATQHRLRKHYQRLKSTGGRLRPLVHLAWRQPVVEKALSVPVYIRSRAQSQQVSDLTGETFPELEGTVRISGRRYLHVNLDLLLQRLAAPDLGADEQAEGADANLLAPRYRAYRMIDHRRMRSDRLHYIDHPLLGVLVLATAYEHAEPETTAAPESESAPNPAPTQAPEAQDGVEPGSGSLANPPPKQASQP